MTQRSAFGYLRLEHGASADDLDCLRLHMAECAAQQGLLLAELFVDSADSTNSAFAALMDALSVGEVTTVVVPSMRHLARMEGVSIALKEYIESQSGANIIIAANAITEEEEGRRRDGSG